MANASYTLTMLIRSKGARTVKLDVNKVTGASRSRPAGHGLSPSTVCAVAQDCKQR